MYWQLVVNLGVIADRLPGTDPTSIVYYCIMTIIVVYNVWFFVAAYEISRSDHIFVGKYDRLNKVLVIICIVAGRVNAWQSATL